MASSFDYDFVKDATPAGYEFPSHRLKRTCDPNRQPLILVACGSFSPITFLHLRMFPMGRDHAWNEGFEVVGGYLSCSSYRKKGLAPAYHRIQMCEIAAKNASSWLMFDPWEAQRPVFTPTARVLDHFDYEINHVMGGIECTDGTRKRAKIVLLAGADLIQTLSTPGVWDARDVDHILSHYGTFVLERNGTELDSAIANLKQWEHNIHVVRQVVSNDVSSTKVRLLIKRDMSIDYLIPDAVIDYIYENNLYKVDFDLPPLPEPKGKERATSNGATSGPSDG
uniref:Nicotinamide-nucleotide adenylyltransferase n=1 Tax=Bionectria ochroleuca TaxID=29856 RepID=A0A0B7K032_BIOOC